MKKYFIMALVVLFIVMVAHSALAAMDVFVFLPAVEEVRGRLAQHIRQSSETLVARPRPWPSRLPSRAVSGWSGG